MPIVTQNITILNTGKIVTLKDVLGLTELITKVIVNNCVGVTLKYY